MRHRRASSATPAAPAPRRGLFPSPVIIVTIVAVVLLALVLTGWGRGQLRKSFTRLPSAYTELYFADPSHLPTQLASGSVAEVPFVIHNKEGKSTSYSYTTTVAGPGGSVDAGGEVAISNDQTDRLIAKAKVGQPGDYVVTVKLKGRPETLQFKIVVST